ncbi:uncharacterized protein [Drosophila suzukii]|uniref:Uncharacterized protein n=1 Tax=Drosophila suzukii TaxID=28584 RepID=A0AB40DBF1_DROSZ
MALVKLLLIATFVVTLAVRTYSDLYLLDKDFPAILKRTAKVLNLGPNISSTNKSDSMSRYEFKNSTLSVAALKGAAG